MIKNVMVKTNPFGVEVIFKILNNDIMIYHPYFYGEFVLLTDLISNNTITKREFNFFSDSVYEMGYRLSMKPTIKIRK
jgi:hypothetical protein